jgi:hypothetical protein
MRRQPGRHPPPDSGPGEDRALRGCLLVRGGPPGGARNRARRPRRGRARRGVWPPRHLVPVPLRDRTDLRAPPQAGTHQPRAPDRGLGDRKPRPSDPRRHAADACRRGARRGARRFLARSARTLPREPRGPSRRRSVATATSLRRGIAPPALVEMMRDVWSDVRATTASRTDAATARRPGMCGRPTGSTTRSVNTTPGRPGLRAWPTGTARRSFAPRRRRLFAPRRLARVPLR